MHPCSVSSRSRTASCSASGTSTPTQPTHRNDISSRTPLSAETSPPDDLENDHSPSSLRLAVTGSRFDTMSTRRATAASSHSRAASSPVGASGWSCACLTAYSCRCRFWISAMMSCSCTVEPPPGEADAASMSARRRRVE